MSVDIGQAAVDAVISHGQLRVVDSKQVQRGCVDVVHLRGVVTIQGFVAPFIGRTVADSAANPASAEPVGKHVRIVIASLTALCRWHAAELRRPQNDGVIQQPALFQIPDQRGSPNRHAHGQRFVVAFNVFTESVFSMDGDWAALTGIVEIKKRYGALLLLDEAHAVGVIGKNGRGLADQLGLAEDIDIHMGTLSKALGASGGYVAGSRKLIDLLINRARSFIYSTAPSPAVAAAGTAAIEFLMSPAGEKRRQTLRAHLAYFAGCLPQLFAEGQKVQSAIIPVVLGPSEAALAASRMLADKGFFVPAIRFPTVARDAARLRVTISARHTPKQIDALCAILRTLI